MENNIKTYLSEIENYVKKNTKTSKTSPKLPIQSQISPLSAFLTEWELKMFLKTPTAENTP